MIPRIARAVLGLALAASCFAQKVPRPAGEFVINLNNSRPILLSQYSGKVVVVIFLYTTCPHCQHTTQILSGIQKEYGDRGLQILGAAFNPNAPDLVPGFIQQFRPVFPVGFAERESVEEYLQQPPGKPSYVPQMVFIDRGRTIREQHTGSDDFFKDQEKNIRTLVESLLKEPATAKKAHATRKKPS